ncbi:MAG: hypothetical protein QM703_22915 [Gemmatales bacterium]
MATGMVNGQYAFDCGFKREGTRSQEKFYLGKDAGQAEIRKAMVKEVLRVKGGSPVWTESFLTIAKAVSKGEREVEVDFRCSPAQQVQEAEKLQKEIPFVRIKVAQEVEAQGKEVWSLFAQEDLEKLRPQLQKLKETGLLGGLALGANGFGAMAAPQGTLHAALDQFVERDIKTTNVKPETRELNAYGMKREEMVRRFQRDLKDCPLAELTFAKCDGFFKFYNQRPLSKNTGKPISIDDVQNCHKGLRRFFRWLDVQEYGWTMPRGLENQTYRPVLMSNERKLSSFIKDSYTPDELATLARHCTPMDRFILVCALNFAGGAGELGRITLDEIKFDEVHPYADRFGIPKVKQTWFRYIREKKGVFGEFVLWPETIELVKWGIARARKLGSELLFCTEEGTPMYKDGTTNAQAGFANSWRQLIDRVRKSHPDFRYLPLGSVRDTLPDIMTQRYDDTLASMLITHGTPFKGDKLLECYSNKPWGRFHKAVAELREVMLPVLSAPNAYESRKRIFKGIE